jgi:hypothetical protein
MSARPNLETALRLGRAGIPVFPCINSARKKPATAHGFYDASTNAERIRNMPWHGMLIAMRTGEASGFSVLDIDLPRHAEAGDWFDAHDARLPSSYFIQTRSGGLHGIFRHRAGLRCSVKQICLGVDVRAEGGYAVLWQPEDFADWLEDRRPIAPWPGWLRPPEPARTAPARANCGAIADRYRVECLIGRVARSVEGERNSILFWANCRLAGMWFPRDADRNAAIDAMLDAALSAGLSEAETTRTIESAFKRIERDQAAEDKCHV